MYDGHRVLADDKNGGLIQRSKGFWRQWQAIGRVCKLLKQQYRGRALVLVENISPLTLQENPSEATWTEQMRIS